MSSKSMTTLPAAAVEGLRARVEGPVYLPGDEGYDAARQPWNLLIDQHPAVILVAESAADVQEGVRFAGDTGLGIAVQATGHGASRPADDALLIVTSRMTDVRINANAQTAWIEAGTKWGTVLEKTQAVGLAPLLGSSPEVGAVGYTLGGGLGWLARKYGLAVDSVLTFEVVTPSGELVRASETENSDLFWALRGSGGGFGIVTAMEMQLYPVTDVYGGFMVYPPDVAQEVFARYREWTASAPEELTSSVRIANFPPLPIVPEMFRGKTVLMVLGCYCGPVEEGEALLQTWRDWMPPLADTFRPMPFSEVATISNDPVDPMPSFVSGMWLDELSDDIINSVIRYGLSVDGSSPFVITEIRHVGGAAGQVSPDANAYGHRQAPLVMEVISFAPSPEALHHLEAHMNAFRTELAPHTSGALYLNFLEGREKWARTEQAFAPKNYQRLTALKGRYDPDNRMRYSTNIPPVPAMVTGDD